MLVGDPALHDPCGSSVGSRSIIFAIQICQPDQVAKPRLNICVEAADVFGNRPFPAFKGRPEICKRCKVHADSDHVLHDILEAGILPRGLDPQDGSWA